MIDKINLSVDAENLGQFCQKLIKRSRDIAKTHDALVTLESFILLFGKAAHGTREYQVIEDLVKSCSEQTRIQLLSQRADELKTALQQCSVTEVTAIHTPLSRDGFYSILQSVIVEMLNSQLADISHWAINWSAEAKQKAEAASGFPDALDFDKAGIDIEEYHAMLDVSHYLENRDSH